MFPAEHSVQITGPGKSGDLNGPQYAANVEAEMAQQARHKTEVRLKMARLFQQYRAQLIQQTSKHNVTVTSYPPSTNEKISFTVYENRKIVPITVKNSGAKAVYLTFEFSELVNNIFTVRDYHGNVIKTMKQLPLGPGEACKLKVHFYSEHAGFYEHLLIFRFQTQQQSSDLIQTFEIMRLLEVTHRTSFSEDPLPAASNSVCDLPTGCLIPAKRLMFLRLMVPLRNYPMPDSVRDLENSNMVLETRPLDWKNYCQRFRLLLHLEELQMNKDIETFNRDGPLLRHKSNTGLLFTQIGGISKNSPLALSGIQVLVTPLDQSRVFERKIYKGWVHHVDVDLVYLKLSDEFLSCFKEGMQFRFQFTNNRMPLRTQHRAAALVYRSRLKEVLFPTGQFSSHHSHLPRLTELGINPEQLKAVQHIVAATAKPAPYLVFGPPGTGKTVTLVEAIKQIVKMQPLCKILACAPSNSATDHLCERILDGELGSLFRFYALSYPVRKIPPKIQLCCNLDLKTNRLMIHSKCSMMRYKILVTSLQTAGRLVTGGFPTSHYTYLFVDEAGQATETESIIPIAGLLKPQTCQIVLAGDPKQLGPIITSRVAEKHGLGVSLLERLMNDVHLYKQHRTHGFNSCFVTKLLRNYRSHPAILKIPNELFYNGELQPYAQRARCSSYCKWECLPKKGFPLIFHGVAGTDEREGNSPSVFNMAEVELLKEYLKALIDYHHKNGVTKIEPGEIGIIAPYRKQVEKIQIALQTDTDLRKENLENVLVGSVENFQGKEFKVILMSTVRSNPKMTACWQRFTIGFVDNEKRFNVALTRAQALLIVIGDPRVLKTDYIWNKFIHYCFKEGGYRGITVSDAEEDALTDALSSSPCGE